jgi:hypothetical protein
MPAKKKAKSKPRSVTIRLRSKAEYKSLAKKVVPKKAQSLGKRFVLGAKTFKKSPRKAMSNVKQNVKRYVHKKTAPRGRKK